MIVLDDESVPKFTFQGQISSLPIKLADDQKKTLITFQSNSDSLAIPSSFTANM